MSARCAVVVMLVAGAAAGGALADPSLELRLTSDPLAGPGEPVTCELWMCDLSCAPGVPRAVGYQAFVAFYPDRLEFIGGIYTAQPFGLPLLPIADLGGELDLAAGINPLLGQVPTCGTHRLAVLTFVARAAGGGCMDIRFREHVPPSRLADEEDQAIEPLGLITMPAASAPADFDGDCDVDWADFLVFRSCWSGPGNVTPPGGCPPAVFHRADFDGGDGDVDLGDFARLQVSFTGPS